MKRAVVGFAATAAGVIVTGGAAPQMAHAAATSCVLPQNLGPKGDTGQPGPAGATGAAGVQGDTGPAATTPPPPPPGPQRTAHVAPRTPLECVDVAVLCLVQAPAPQGLVGSTGQTGPTGATGATGPVGDRGQYIDFLLPPAGQRRDAHVVRPQGVACGGLFAPDCVVVVDGGTGPAGDTGLQGAVGQQGATGPKGDTGPDLVNCGPQRGVHAAHAAKPSVEVHLEGGRAIAIVRPGTAGGSSINIPTICELPSTGGSAAPLVIGGVIAAGAGLVALEASRKRRWFRRAG